MVDSDTVLRLFYPYSSGFEFILYDALGLLFLAGFFDFEKPFRLRNLDLLMVAAWVPLGDYEKGYWPFTTAVGYGLLYYFFIRLLLHHKLRDEAGTTLNFSTRTYWQLTAALVVFAAVLTFTYPEPYTGLSGHQPYIAGSAAAGTAGARCLLNGDIVYGNVDALAPVGQEHYDWAWDAYGPTYYYTFLPFEYLFPTEGHFKFSYNQAARAATTFMHCGSIALLNVLGRQMGGARLGAGLGFAWAVLPYSLIPVYNSKSGDLMPGFLTLLALVALRRSSWLGAAGLAYVAAAALYPVFLIPVWAATLLGWRRRAGFVALTCMLGLLLSVSQFLQPDGIAIFVDATYGNQERFGDWPWSVWTQYPSMKYLRAYLQLLFLPIVAGIAWLARGSSFPGALAYGGALVVYVEMFKLYVPGRYHLWMQPFFLAYFLAYVGRPVAADPIETTERRGV